MYTSLVPEEPQDGAFEDVRKAEFSAAEEPERRTTPKRLEREGVCVCDSGLDEVAVL